MKNALPLIFLFCHSILPAQLPSDQLIVDQTFRLDGTSEFVYAFAEGDQITLTAQELTGKKLKDVEVLQYPDYPVFRAYELDSILTKTLYIPKTGVYLLRFREAGLSKKVCRFTLRRSTTNPETVRFDTRVPWDIRLTPDYRVSRRPVPTGKKTEVIALGGQVTVNASKFYLKKAVNAYQFTLPPNTLRWAYRISVGQSAAEARRSDSEKLTAALQSGAAKLLALQPETALGAFALGMAIDMTVSTAGEDVEYALLDWNNWGKFSRGENYDAHIQQGGVSVDAQRRYSPLEGTWFFALKSNNWVDDINVTIDIEVVTEVQLFETELYLEPYQP